MEQKVFGQVLLNLSLITEEQLDQALIQQAASREHKPLGELLMEMGLIDEKTINTILSIQSRRVPVEKTQAGLKREVLEERLRGARLPDYLELARELEASDLYLSVGEPPVMRIHGNLVELPVSPLEPEDTEAMLIAVLDSEQIAEYRKSHHVDHCLTLGDTGRVRMSMYQHRGGAAAAFRMLMKDVVLFKDLKLPTMVAEFATKSNGLFLVTGPSGSGKSTTLASLVEFINERFRRHIITIENPIEVVYESKEALVTQREVGAHTRSYAKALKAALREDPDVIVVGEIADPETMAMAIAAAETGHLVIGTMHTQTSYSTIVRILDQFPPQKRSHVRNTLAQVLRGILCQQLVPNLDGRGRSLAHELLVLNSAIAKLIRDDRLWQIPTTMQLGAADSMRLMDDSLLELVNKGRITLQEARARATEPEKFLNLDKLPRLSDRRSQKSGQATR